MKLLNRLYLKPNELLPSYLHRLANGNGYRNIQTLMKLLGEELVNTRVPSKRLFFGDFDTEKLASLVNQPHQQIESRQLIKHGATRFSYMEQNFLAKAFDFTYLKVCPHCYSEVSTFNFLNSLKMKSCCTKHRCSLLSINPDNGKKLSWSTHHLKTELPEWVKDIPAREITEQEFLLNQHIEHLWEQQPSSIYPVLNNLNLSELIDVCSFLSHFHLRAFPTHQDSDTPFLIAHDYLCDWPNKFYELLDYFQKHPMRMKGLTGIRNCYRDLYDDLCSIENSQSDGYRLLKKAFDQFIQSHFSNGNFNSKITLIDSDILSSRAFVNQTQAMAVLDIPVSKFKVLLRESFLKPKTVLKNGDAMYARTDINTLKTRLERCLSLEGAAKLLDLSQYRLRLLINGGIIKPLLKPTKANRDWLIEKEELESFVKRLVSCAQLKVTKSNKHQVKQFQFFGVDFLELVKQMLGGQIAYTYNPLKRSPMAFKQFIPVRSMREQPDPEWLSPAEACTFLEVNKNVVYELLKKDFIKGKKKSVKRTARPVLHIHKSSAIEFKNAYQLRHQIHEPERYTVVHGKSVDGFMINLYQRI
ncbi:hypothetical protein D5018_06810 [Parashewanella curva]|uniref:TniQ domain-containing protein n=1 Tax=Parashewanella curva TaxID=2338552 RepID=A0A3L8PYH3_9GAMM|nr:TniQ family protein [Parashewanella curva]RLV60497.1 hypothetical protein D5018_06810 [Parashewanella curva]